MERVAEVLINRPSKHLDRTFSYRIPETLSHMGPGWRCVIPFSGRTVEGIILSVREEEPARRAYQVKDIIAAVDDYPWFTADMLALGLWISRYYMCTAIEALRLFLIDKKGIRTHRAYRVQWEKIPAGHMIRGVLDESIPKLSEEEASQVLGVDALPSYVSEGYLKLEEEPEAVHKRPIEKWIASSGDGSLLPGKKQRALQELLDREGPQPVRRLMERGFSATVLQGLCKNGGGHFLYRPKDTYSLTSGGEDWKARMLTDEQDAALARITEAVAAKRCKGMLLMGVTGSGKTEVYLRSAEYALQNGGTVLVLVPEIALTAQMADYFSARFGDDVVFIHSQLSKGERYNNRMRVQQGESHIVIGSRSALFLPYQNLSLIIVDEEYDSSYKQDETPYYNGRDAAKKLAEIAGCPIVLGAATPAVGTYASAEAGRMELLKMTKRVHDTPLPEVTVVDMKGEIAAGNTTVYSREMLDRIGETVRCGDKVILFLNRRGYSTSLFCTDCGYAFKCPNCDVSLVYHKDRNCLKCHYCECVFPLPKVCPKCGSPRISYTGRGTEKVEEQLASLLPGISCRRLDLDSTSRKHSARQILQEFREGKFSVLLGTQMVTKGHDIPGVQMVGILDADSILNMPTYLAAEQAYILITQCAGRAGRGTRRGQVVLQTYTPEHYAVRAAVRQDYEAFYRQEIRYRRALSYPPFVRMMKITCFSKNYGEALSRAERISRWMRAVMPHLPDQVTATPPYDEPVKKVRNTYYVSLTVKGASLAPLKAAMREEKVFRENGILIDVDPLS